uniref:UBP1-associated protein 2C n=1 Tax=Rhizophora mucronata TaxID=61149 RepID=A0A2P2J969_RHIMU
MDPTKKRKLEGNGVVSGGNDSSNGLTPEDARRIMERFTAEQLLDILQTAAVRHPDVLDAVRSIADSDTTQRKLFVRGLGWETTTENLRTLFSAYGELEEAVVIIDKNTGKSKGYGFVIYKHVDGAMLALKEPSKKIDGRVTVTQLAAAGNSGANNSNLAGGDVAMRKIYVANVPYDMPADKLLAQFAVYGDIEEGPLGFDKQTGKSRGFALFVYKTAEGAQAALVEPVKTIDGRQLNCKLAIDGKKGKPGVPGQPGVDVGQGQAPAGNVHADGMGMGMGMGIGMVHQGPYGGPGGIGPYSGFSGSLQGPPPMAAHHPLSSSFAGSGLTSQGPGSLTGGSGYASSATGFGGPYSGYGGPGSTGFAGLGSGAGAGSGALTGGSAGLGAGAPAVGGSVGGASSLYRLPPSSVGMPSSGYPEAGHYNLSSSSASFPSQHQGTSPAPRAPPGGMYPSMPPYY